MQILSFSVKGCCSLINLFFNQSHQLRLGICSPSESLFLHFVFSPCGNAVSATQRFSVKLLGRPFGTNGI